MTPRSSRPRNSHSMMNSVQPSMMRSATPGSSWRTRHQDAGQRLADRERHAEIDAAARRARQSLELHPGAVELAQHRPHTVAEHHARAGEGDAAAVAGEQGDPEVALERAHVAGQRRLRDVQPLGRLGDALELAHLDKILQLAQVHGHPTRTSVDIRAGCSCTRPAGNPLHHSYQFRHEWRAESNICSRSGPTLAFHVG